MKVTGAVLASTILLSCASESQPPARKLKRTDVLVLADLSDRISPSYHPEQIRRDTAIIRMIAEEFGTLVARNRYLFSQDRLRILYVGGENEPWEARVDAGEMNRNHRVVVRELPKELEQFSRTAAAPYLLNRTQYIGADLWSWFRHSAPRAFEPPDTTHENITRIIILTDGYLEFAPSIPREAGTAMRMSALRKRADWSARYEPLRLKPVENKLVNAKILMLELSPLRPEINTTERDILERYWTDWFQTMGADVRFYSNKDPLPSVRDAIRSFLEL